MRKLFSSGLITLIFFLILTGFLIFLNSKNYLKIPKDIFYTLSEPIQKVSMASFNKTSSFIDLISSIKNLRRENIRMKEELRFLKAENARLKEIAYENKILREQFKLSIDQKLQLISSYVIGRSSKNFSQYLLIDKGLDDGVEKGNPVITSGGILIGKVSEVSSGSAKVLLITDPSSVINAVIQETRASGIVKGEYGLGLVMDMIPQNEEVNIGDTVITSAFGGDFPKGLLIGQIKEIRGSENQIFQKAIIEPAADFERLEIVFIVQ